MKFLIHADGGEDIGLGHLSRAVTLANQFSRAGYQTTLAIPTELSLTAIARKDDKVTLQTTEAPEDVMHLMKAAFFDSAIIDSYRWSHSELLEARKQQLTVVFDDEALNDLPVDAIINGSPGANEMRYEKFSATHKWLGVRYQIIRDAFQNFTRPKYVRDTVQHIIALAGGCSDTNLIVGLLTLLKTCSERLGATVKSEIITGPLTPSFVPSLFDDVSLIQNPDDLPLRMADADIAISAGGQTLYELAYCGTPTIGFTLSSDQNGNVFSLSKLGSIVSVGNYPSQKFFATLGDEIISLSGDLEKRSFLSTSSRQLIDGRGAERLMRKILELCL